MEDNGRRTGTVQWFSRIKGYGFVRPDEQEEDVFVHYSSIRGDGYRNLDEGQRVEFTVEESDKGPQAVDVVELEAQRVEFTVEESDKNPQAADVVELEAQEGASLETVT